MRPAWAHTCGCKSRCELVTVSKAKRNCVRATERMNKSEHVSFSGFRFIPEDEFIATLGEIQVNLTEYTETTGEFTLVWNLIRGRKPWLDGQ